MTGPADVDPQALAVAEYRTTHPEDSDLPDDAIASLTVVQMRAFALALARLGREVADALALKRLAQWLGARRDPDA